MSFLVYVGIIFFAKIINYSLDHKMPKKGTDTGKVYTVVTKIFLPLVLARPRLH